MSWTVLLYMQQWPLWQLYCYKKSILLSLNTELISALCIYNRIFVFSDNLINVFKFLSVALPQGVLRIYGDGEERMGKQIMKTLQNPSNVKRNPKNRLKRN